jgi:sugar/nucleoside kinase (ribokinase family)
LATTVCLTRGPKGCIVAQGSQRIEVPAVPTQAVDTNGAGDMFAGAFLYGITSGVEPALAAKGANYMSMKVITQVGARLHHGAKDFWNTGITA